MSGSAGRVADSTGNWVDTAAPSWLRPYLRLARLDRPIGSWLLLLPCWWSAGIAAIAAGKPYPDPWHCLLFFIGAFAMRGAGCTWNDITDRDLDDKVERTRSRPIPSGQVTVGQAMAFLVLQALIGLAVLVQFNPFTILMGILSLATVAIYPFLKRITHWPPTNKTVIKNAALKPATASSAIKFSGRDPSAGMSTNKGTTARS